MMSCSIHYTCPNNANVADPAVAVAAVTPWEIKQKKREKKLQKLEKEMKMETVTVTPTVTPTVTAVATPAAGAIRGKAVDAEDEEGANDEERE